MENRNPENKSGVGLHESLQELVGLHRQLLEAVKTENEAISNADVKATYEATSAKEALLHWIHRAELGRQAAVHTLCQELALDPAQATLRSIILLFQSSDPALSERLQTDLTALLVLVDRIKKQNELNGRLLEESLGHIQNMKKNIFGETNPKAATYNQSGMRNAGSPNAHGPRFVSKEV